MANRLNNISNEEQDILNSLRPIAKTLPKIPKVPKFYQMPGNIDMNRTARNSTIFNPITGNYLDNYSSTRKRIKEAINKSNESIAVLTRQREQIIRQRNKLYKNNYVAQHLTNARIGDMFSNFMYIELFTTGITTTQEFYNFVKTEIDNINSNFWVMQSVQLHWTAPRNRAIWRSIDGSNFDNYENFISRYNDIVSGASGDVGSDPIDTNVYNADFSKIVIYFSRLRAVQSEAIKNVFKVLDVNNGGKKDECFMNCLEHMGIPSNSDAVINTYEAMIKFIKNNKLKVRVISNIIRKIDMQDIKNNNQSFSVKVGKNYTCLYPIKMSQFKITTLFCNEDTYDYTLLYCPVDKHVDIIPDNHIQIVDDLCISSTGQLFNKIDDKYTLLYDAKIVYKFDTEHAKQEMDLTYVFFDYETVVDWDCSNCMEPYSLSWFYMSHKEMETIAGCETKPENETTEEKQEREFMQGVIRKTIEKQTLRNPERIFNYVGFDCNKKFIEWIIEFQKNRLLKFVSFNGANFDNFILFRGIVEYKMINNNNNTIHFNANDVQYNGNQLLNFKFNGRHSMYDIHKHLVGSLKDNCNGFKVPAEFSKQEIDHNEIQMKYNKCIDDAIEDSSITDMQKRVIGKEKFISMMRESEKLESYNNNDVLSLAVLFYKYYNSLVSIKGYDFLHNEEFTKYTTIGSIIKKRMDLHIIEKKMNLPKLDINQYEDLQKYKIAGRCDTFNGTIELFEKIASLDVCSLYPFVMAVFNCYYPCGDIKNADKYYKPSEKLGFWYCDIDQRALKAHNLPNIYAEKTGTENLWGSEDILENYLISNITIELLKKYENIGVVCNIKNSITVIEEDGKETTRNSFYFTEKMKSTEMFEFIAELMKAKNDQDLLDSVDDDRYNPALRSTLKLLMNSLSGKVIQGLFNNKVCLIDKLDDYEKIKAKYDINTINHIGDKIFVSYTMENQELIKRQSPIYLGCFIYEYARTYMYEKMLAPVGLNACLYMDTDALKFRDTDMRKWYEKYGKEPVPHWEEIEKYDIRYKENHPLHSPNSKVFGSFENELKDNNLFILLQKKFWLVANIIDGEVLYIKTRYKGVNPKSLLLNGDEEFVIIKNNKYKMVDDKKIKIRKDDEEEDEEDIITENTAEIKEDYTDLQVFNWCNTNNNGSNKEIGSDYEIKKGKAKGAIKNQIKFFQNIYHNGEAFVLCNNLRRVVKNSQRNVGIEDKERFNNLNNTIQLKFLVKKIKLN